MEEYLNKKIMLDEFVTHNMPFENINEAFDLMHSGKRYVNRNVHVNSIGNIVKQRANKFSLMRILV